jgi:hypothetical protein
MGWGCTGHGEHPRLPPEILLIQEEDAKLGKLFTLYPSDDQDRVAGSTLGYLERVSGPFRVNFALVASDGTTIALARTVFLSISHQMWIQSCVNSNDVFLLDEGIWNKIQNLGRRIVGSFTRSEYKLYRIAPKTELVGTSQHSGYQVKSLTISGEHVEINAVLIDRHFHGDLDEWWVDEKLRDKNTLPGFLGPMITGNMAFAMAGRKPRAGPRGQPALLASDVGQGRRMNTTGNVSFV